jgi:hypothetical protein
MLKSWATESTILCIWVIQCMTRPSTTAFSANFEVEGYDSGQVLLGGTSVTGAREEQRR